jgi:hypothetical protein
MNYEVYEIPCNPVPAAEVNGFRFGKDQEGVVVARCVFCKVGFVVTDENAAETRHAMIRHLETIHGLERRPAAQGAQGI